MLNYELRMLNVAMRCQAAFCIDYVECFAFLHSAFRILHSAFLYFVVYSFDLQNLECFLNKGFHGGVGHLLEQLVECLVDGSFAEAQYRQC